jgi:hypothetical protein
MTEGIGRSKRKASSTPTPHRPPRLLRTVSETRKKNVAAAAAAAAETRHRTTLWTAAQINERATVLFFPQDVIENQPLVLSARIFSAYSLAVDSRQQERSLRTIPQCSSQQCSEKLAVSSIAPILPLLRSLVQVEAVSLATNDPATTHLRTVENYTVIRRRIHFCGFDCSAVQPPVDRVDGSGLHQQESIQTLLIAKRQADALVERHLGAGGDFAACLQAVVEFLDGHEDSDYNECRSWWMLECAKAIGADYPVRRVAKAVEQYRRELSIILERMNANQPMPLLLIDETNDSTLVVERCLSQSVGQAIRYNLRKFFNSAPPRLTPADTDYEQREQNYSKVKQLITMTLNENKENVAVDDECIAALVSTALLRLYECFGLDAMLSPLIGPPVLPALFCTHPASNKGFQIRGPPALLTATELDDVLHDIERTYAFVAAANACQFLLSLWTVPGVQDEINRLGGWPQIETYATISWCHALWKISPNDGHLVLLCNYQALLERLQNWCASISAVSLGCNRELIALQKRFHANTKSKNVLTNFPQIQVIRQCLEEGRAMANAFPQVSMAGKKDR